AAGVGALKGPGVAHLGLVASLVANDNAGRRSAIQAVAEAAYVFTTTKPSAKPRALARVRVGWADAGARREGVREGRARGAGGECAKEWATRPANPATPPMLADAAKKRARGGVIKTDVLAPTQVEALGMGAFLAVARGSAEP